ncbi:MULTISPECIES: plasmid replication/partition related protein [unclassified Acidovorax]|uniref:plasmid replication/partition related protein n=1 Tax=unclassified Acidovorax TaxID=2684926 RepID=UPI0028830AC1|nr:MULTISPECIES: plasmid replication/partition related protein [unclassified Acidovorax]
MHIVVNEELKAYIDPLTPQELESLERSILAEGCRDALVLWGDVLVDGHNRYGICVRHGLPFQTVQATRFETMEDVHLWMIEQHLGRRSVSDFQRGILALRKKEIMQARQSRTQATQAVDPSEDAPADQVASLPTQAPDALDSREAIARAARISSSQVLMIEKIRKQAAPEVVAAVKSGAISINAAAAVATLPQDEQVAAATAGKNELRQAAKRVREAKRKPPSGDSAEQPSPSPASGAAPSSAVPDELQSLRDRVTALTAENAALRARLQALGDDAAAPF